MSPSLAPFGQFILDQSDEAIIATDSTHRVIGFNSAATRFFGSIPGGPLNDWSTTLGLYLPDGTTKFPESEFPKGQANKTLRMVVRNSTLPKAAFVSMKTFALPKSPEATQGWVYHFQDLGPVRELERNLRDSETQLRLLFDAHPEVLWIVDNVNSTVIEANEATKALYGHDREEVLGKRFSEFQDKENPKLHRRKNAEPFEVTLTSHAIRYRGKGATLLRIASKRMDSPQDSDAAMVERLRLTTQGMLCSAIGHELNNPLAAISGYARLIDASGFVTPKIKECTNEIITAAEQIEKIVRYLRGMARRKRTDPAELDLNQTIEEALSVFKRQLGCRDIHIELEPAPEKPRIWGDRYQIQNIFQNLVVRSRDAFDTAKEGIKKEIRVVIRSGKHSVTITYEDSADWSQTAGKYSEDLSGVKELLRRQRATVQEQQMKGKLTLNIEFSKGRPSLEGTESIVSDAPQTTVERGKKRLLIVDDNQALAKLLAQLVGSEYRTRLCFDARSAIQELTHSSYDIVLTDLTLPDSSGIEVLQYVKGHSPETPVIIITGKMKGDTEVQSALSCGAASVLYKPFPNSEKIRFVLKEAIKGPAKRAA